MRYALRNQDKIAAAYSPEYLQQHLIDSLNKFFEYVEEAELEDFWIVRIPNERYQILRISDIADENCMLEFAIISRQFDVLKLAFLGRMKG